ncbi:Tetratricopeptide-like helical domain-containing protein [Dioscorea alata]|uniref:Tetratricopeptide-like helical domain-containing protein n=1 Tax=Dioscorea alata TaxID=55571 RepID=A0ACB7V4C6_DIOAL|nr:Tetratricopeptide-like helical domain-containing protein [Dioscorea alata]
MLSRILARAMRLCKTRRQLEQVHAQILCNPGLSMRTTSSLLSRLLLLYSSLPSSTSFLLAICGLFVYIPSPTLSSFNTVLRSLAAAPPSSLPPLHPISLYSQLLSSGLLPNHLTFPFLFKHCSLRLLATSGQCLHSHVFKLGFHLDVFIQNAMVFFYATCGFIRHARRLFDEMPQKDLVSWNSLLIGYLRCGEADEAMDVFRRMGDRNVISWNSIITGFVQCGREKAALSLFHEMQAEGFVVKPDKITVASVISACASLGAFDQGRWVHGYLKMCGIELDVVIGTALIDMYGKCGCLARALEVFDEMPDKDVLAWTAMISAFAIHGFGEEAFALLEKMERHGTKPNQVTFGALLCACAHSGMVERGRWCFEAMKRVYMIEPQQQHYACMVDLLGRAGLFAEALMLIGSMPMEADTFVWGALLGACRMHGNVELGERVAGLLIGMDHLNHAFYIILSDIYAKADRFEDVKKVRKLMQEHGIKKAAPGCSSVEIDGEVREFSVKLAPCDDDVLDELVLILDLMHEELKIQ